MGLEGGWVQGPSGRTADERLSAGERTRMGLVEGTEPAGSCDWTCCQKLRCWVGLGACSSLLSGTRDFGLVDEPHDCVDRSTCETDSMVSYSLVLSWNPT